MSAGAGGPTWTGEIDDVQSEPPVVHTSAVVALATAVAVAVGTFLPYLSAEGVSVSLSDDATGSLYIGLLGPPAIAVVGAIARSRTGAAIAVGSAAGAGGLVLIIVAFAYEVVSEASTADFLGDYSYEIGFVVHSAAAIGAIVLVVIALNLVTSVRTSEAAVIPPLISLIGAAGLCAFAVGVLMPVDGFGILDIGQTITPAYIAFLATVVVPGVFGFASRRPTGAALGFGAAITPLCLWISDAVANNASGAGFFAGFDEGNTALLAVGAIAAGVCGLIGFSASEQTAAQAREPAQRVIAPEGPAWASPAPSESPASSSVPGTHRLVIDVSDEVPTASGMTLPGETGGQSVTASAPVPGGWHPDPYERFSLRWWDGARWTEHVLDAAHIAAVDQPGYG